MDKLIKATALKGDVRIIATESTELVNKGVMIHGCAPTAAAAFGRMLTAGALMGSMLKSKQDSITIQISGGGEAKGVIVTSYADAHVKGYIGNPAADLPVNSKGKLDVAGIIGLDGNLTVIKDMGMKEPYVGQSPISSGEIGDDLAYYFTISEQTPSAVGLGVLVDTDCSVKAAGGFIIQMMPGANEMVADIITYRLQEIPSITEMLSDGMGIEDIIKYIFEDMQLNILESIVPEYRCDCSKEKVERALLSIGKEELENIYNEGKTEEIQCHFCNETYLFTHDEVGNLLLESSK